MGDAMGSGTTQIDVEIGTARVSGYCEPAFVAVAVEFIANFTTRDEIGAAVCVHHRGKQVVDLCGGIADPASGREWDDRTICIIWSATKPATALCIHLLAERGLLDLDRPIAEFWPEYAAEGKATTTTRMVLDHTAGVPVVSAPLKPDCLLDPAYMAEKIAAQAPFWEPGSRTAYHPLTGGFILAEIIRRIDGRDLGRFFAEEISSPLGLDFWIGLPAAEEPRAAPVIAYRPPRDEPPGRFLVEARRIGSLQNLFLFNHGDWKSKRVNTPEGRQAAIGAASGMTNAAGLAGLYAALHPDGPLGFRPETLASFAAASSATHLDGMLLQPLRFGPGFMLRMDNRSHGRGDSLLIGPRAFGHVGAGGSVGFCDPDAGLAFGYTMNRQGPGFLLNQRGQSLVDAAYAGIAG